MSKNGFRVMDSDMHVIEPEDLWQRYIAPEFKERAPRGMTRIGSAIYFWKSIECECPRIER